MFAVYYVVSRTVYGTKLFACDLVTSFSGISMGRILNVLVSMDIVICLSHVYTEKAFLNRWVLNVIIMGQEGIECQACV